MTENILLQVRDLEVLAGERPLLRGLDLDLAAGEIVALQGPSGCGKTTLLRTLAWLQDPGTGDIRLDGQSADAMGWTTWRRRLGLVPQLPVAIGRTVGEEFARTSSYRVNTDLPDTDRARRLLDTLLLADVSLDAASDKLSVGQQQRIGLVRTLLLNPSVLLLDEPTSALDPEAAAALEAMVRGDVEARRAAVIVVTHNPTAAARWCDRSLDLRPFLVEAAA